MNIKRLVRLCALALFIALACILPVPMTFYKKDHLPKITIEQVDKKEEDEDESDIKEIF